MIFFKKIICVFFLIGIVTTSYSQNKNDLKLLTQIEDYEVNERAFLILDQSVYLAGETINFQALTFDATLQIPIDYSSILYVELYNQNNEVISSNKYYLENGETVNSITLPRHLQTDYYYIRAYTNYMKNFGYSSFFTRRLQVINPFLKTKKVTETVSDSTELEINISAEGGKIIYGIENKIILSCTDTNKRIHTKFYENDSVINELFLDDGFNVFNFTPYPNNNYKIEAFSSGNENTIIPINNIVESGVVCKLDSLNKNLAYLNILASSYNDYPLSLYIVNSGFTYLHNQTITKSETLLRTFLPAGLNTVILKNNTSKEVAIRNIYIKPESSFNIFAEINKPQSSPGDSIFLYLHSDLNDSLQYIVSMHMGNSKTSPSMQELIQSTSFTSSLSSLQNNLSINELNYLYNNIDDINNYILKFQSNQNLNTKQSAKAYRPEFSNDIVSGNILSKNKNNVVAHKDMYISFVDSISWLNRCKTDSTGRFYCELPINHQGVDLIVTVTDTTENYHITIDDEFYPEFFNITKEVFSPDSTLKNIIEARMLNLQITDAYLNHQNNQNSNRSDLRFYGVPDVEYNFERYVNLPSLEEFIYEIVDNAIPKRKNNKVQIAIISEDRKYGSNPLVILDGVPIQNIQQLMATPCNKLKSLKIITSKFYFGTAVYDGVIDISSKENSSKLIDLEKNTLKAMFPRITTTKQKEKTPFERIPNYSTNIYFNTFIPKSEENRIKIKLPNNQGKYSLLVFGYTKEGKWSTLINEDVVNIQFKNSKIP